MKKKTIDRRALKNSNIKLKTNVFLVDPNQHSLPKQFRHRLQYWELLKYREKYPILWSFHHNDLTEDQDKQKSRYLEHYKMWLDDSRFKPFPPKTNIVPWFEKSPQHSLAPLQEVDVQEVDVQEVDVQEVDVQEVDVQEVDVDLQKQIVEEDPNKCIYVDAPPGTGKTHSLIDRLEWLVKNRYVKNPSEECLVLSFSRAVVRELKSRLQKKTEKGAPDDLAYVTIRTIDSYGTRMMTMGDDDIELVGGYLKRIRQFTRLLQEEGLPREAEKELNKVKFLIVDEVQDLVGSRADMISELVKVVVKNGGSFFCLGDPCQSINDYQLRQPDETSQTTSFDFQDYIKREGGERFVKHKLRKRFRYENKLMNDFVVRCRKAMGEDGRCPDEVMLNNEIDSQFPTVPASDISEIYDVGSDEKYAILCRSNFQVYQMAEFLNQNKVRYHIRTGIDDQMWPAWIGRVFFGFKGSTMDTQKFKKRWEVKIGDKEDCDDAIKMLRECELLCDNIIDIENLCSYIESHPPPFKTVKGIEVATMHKSKGLEYGKVFRVSSLSSYSQSNAENAEECRVLYVAVTRAKNDFYSISYDRALFSRGVRDSRFLAEKVNGFADKSTGEYKIVLSGSNYFDHAHSSMSTGGETQNSQEIFWLLANAKEPVVSARNGNWCNSKDEKLCPVKDLYGSSKPDILNVPVLSFGTIAVPRFSPPFSSAGSGARLLITANLFGAGVIPR